MMQVLPTLSSSFTIGDGILSALVAALIFVLKWLVGRSDRQLEKAQAAIESRDGHIGELIKATTHALDQLRQTQDHLRAALDAFSRFEREEEKVHAEILSRLDGHDEWLKGISASLERTAELQERMLRLLDGNKTT